MERLTDLLPRLLSPLLFVLLLAGCSGSPEPEIRPTPVWTPAATLPPQQATTPAAVFKEQELEPGPCSNDAEFVEDLTIPDLTEVEPGAELDKRWMVLNSGSCDWTAGYSLSSVGDDDFEGPGEIALFPARAGASAVWQVVLRAPQSSGEHISRWQARAPDGSPFGDEVFLYIVIPTPRPAPTATLSSSN